MEGHVEPIDQEFIRRYWEQHWGLPIVSTRATYMPGGRARPRLTRRMGGGAGADHLAHRGRLGRDRDGGRVPTRPAHRRRLIDGAEVELRRRGVARAMIVTTNDNLRALGFYVRHGYRLVKIALDDMDRVRSLKPHVPQQGQEGIPLRDMLELEKDLTASPAPVVRSRLPREVRPESFS